MWYKTLADIRFINISVGWSRRERCAAVDFTVEDDRSIVLVIDEWVGEWTVRFWRRRSSNNVTVCLTWTI